MIDLSYEGTPAGLMQYLAYQASICQHCGGTGIVQKTEWTDTDTSYDVEVRCVCSYQD